MKDHEMTEEEIIKGQKEIDAWFENIPNETAGILKELEDKISQMQTFDLLSNIAVYNHIQDGEEYSDYQGDKMFNVSELITLVALKHEFVSISNVSIENSPSLLKDIQKLGHKYFSLMSFLDLRNNHAEDDHSIAGIASRNRRDETIIRNQGLPEHHLMFSTELYKPLDVEIKKQFGFSVQDSIDLRRGITEIINDGLNKARDAAKEKGEAMAMEVFRYRTSKIIPENALLSIESLEALNKLSRKQIKETCLHHCLAEMCFHIGEAYCFTPQELADFTGKELSIVESFIKQFSCTFPCVMDKEVIFGPTTVLKSKPLVEHDNKILVPSIPLLTWCVEPVIETYIKSVQKLQDRFAKTKHEFLLAKGNEFFSTILKGEVVIYNNLYYFLNDDVKSRCETDGIFKYERTLFIIEGKGHRISQASKQGRIERTETHMKQIVRDAYEQGLRTLDYIQSKPTAEFKTETNKIVKFSKSDFDEVVLVSLVLEPLGNVTPLIRATNELGYFKGDIFPWIISIYDLQIIADHLEFPISLIHYIKRRKEFLSRKIMSIFDEIDLMAYYLFNRLYIERTFKDAEEDNVNMVYFGNETDAINNYYIQKYRMNNPDPPKVTMTLPETFKKILSSLEKSSFAFRQQIMMGILDLSPASSEKIESYIDQVKGMFFKSGQNHDCSIVTELWGEKVGFTFMTGATKQAIDAQMFFYCHFKMNQQQTRKWIGIGDIDRQKKSFNIQSALMLNGRY